MGSLTDNHGVDLSVHRPSDPDHIAFSTRALPAPDHFYLDTVEIDVRVGDHLSMRHPNGRDLFYEVLRSDPYPGTPGGTDLTVREVAEIPIRPTSPAPAADPPTPTWARDMTVLRTIVALEQGRRPGAAIFATEIAEASNLPLPDVEASIAAMEGEYVDGVGRGGAGSVFAVNKVTAEGRRKAQVWPDADQLAAERLVAALAAIATDDAMGETARSVATDLLAVLREHSDVGADVLGRALTRVLGVDGSR